MILSVLEDHFPKDFTSSELAEICGINKGSTTTSLKELLWFDLITKHQVYVKDCLGRKSGTFVYFADNKKVLKKYINYFLKEVEKNEG